MTATDHGVVRDWLKLVGSLNVGAMSEQEFQLRLNAMVPALADEYPPGAFCRQSAYAVAGACAHFPTFGEIVPVLSAWWRTQRPALVAIAGKRGSASEQQEALERSNRASWAATKPAKVRQYVRELSEGGALEASLQNILVTALARNAPQHLGLLPPAWLERGANDPHMPPELVPVIRGQLPHGVGFTDA